jgi:hypothetical protein
MRALFRRAGAGGDRVLNAVLWLHDGIMLFVCLFWLLPLFAAVLLSVFVYDLRPLLHGRLETYLLYGLIALPPWLLLCVYAVHTNSKTAHHLKAWMTRVPVYAGYVVLGVGGALWLFGAI